MTHTKSLEITVTSSLSERINKHHHTNKDIKKRNFKVYLHKNDKPNLSSSSHAEKDFSFFLKKKERNSLRQ